MTVQFPKRRETDEQARRRVERLELRAWEREPVESVPLPRRLRRKLMRAIAAERGRL